MLKTCLMKTGGGKVVIKLESIMKKYYIALASAVLLFAGCSREIDVYEPENPTPGEKTVSVIANVDEELTKVSSDNAGAFKWQNGDVITIVTDNDNIRQFTTSDSGTSADFTGKIPDTDEVGKYAMYPASESHVASGDALTFHIDGDMTWNADASNMPMLGKISGGSATFQAVGGALKLVCFNIPAEADFLLFSATNKQISGDFAIADASIAAPVIATSAKAAGNNEILINFSANYSASKVFYIPLPTGTIDGFTVSLLDDQLDELFSTTTKAGVELGVVANKLIIAPAMNCASPTIIWKETFTGHTSISSSSTSIQTGTGYDAIGDSGITYSLGSSSSVQTSGTMYSGGVGAPELLVKSGNPFTVSNIPAGVNTSLELSWYSNKTTLSVSASTEDVTIGSISHTDKKHKASITIKNSPSTFNLTFSASENTRLDDIVLAIPAASYSIPTITAGDESLTIAVGSSEASTTASLANGVDGLGISCVLSGTNADKFTAALVGTTLTVTAKEVNASAADYTATLTLKATGAASKEIAITQKTKLVPNPTVVTTPGDGKFSASWTADANATSYVAYLHTAATPTPATGGTDIDISNDGSAYSITDYVVDNGTYYLYIKVNGVTSGYEAPTAYVEKTFTCEGTPKGSAADNPYTVAEAIAAYTDNPSIGSKYVKGIVSTAGFTSGKSEYVCCYISDDGTTTNQFELYNITSGESASDFSVGDAVIVHGTLTLYSTTYETSPTVVDVLIKKPVFTPNGANFVTSQSVAIASTGSSSIRYTDNGSAPTTSTGSVYSSALDLSATTTVKAVGIDENAVVCTGVASATFTKLQTYAVTWSAPSNGSITVKNGESTISSDTMVPETATVNITVSPDDGYALSTLVYNDGSDHDIKAAKSFTMPAHAVSITATFEVSGGGPEDLEAPESISITDINIAEKKFSGSWNANADASS